MTANAASRSGPARADRRRLLLFASLVALALLAAQTRVLAAADPKGGGGPGSPEGVRRECQERTDPERGGSEEWRKKHCPKEQATNPVGVEATEAPSAGAIVEPAPAPIAPGNGNGNGKSGKPKDESGSASGHSGGGSGSGGKSAGPAPVPTTTTTEAAQVQETVPEQTASAAPATGTSPGPERDARTGAQRPAEVAAIEVDADSSLCGGVFSGSPPGSLTKSATRNGSPLANGGAILPGDTLVFTITWNTGDWVGGTLDKVADCVSINGSLNLGLSAGEKPTANDGAFTHTIVVPAFAGGTALCDRARLSGQPAPGSQSTQKSNHMCFTVGTAPPQPGAIEVEVQKTNDADQDGTFTDLETAPAVGSSVNFQAVITNKSGVPIVISSLTDVYFGVSAFTITCPGAEVGTTIPAGGSVTCSFTVPNYAPAAGESLVDIVTVVANEVGNPSNTDTDSDDSTVKSPGPPPPPPAINIEVVKTNDANTDGTFGDAETAPAPGTAVAFLAVITNESDVAVMVASLTDEYASVAAFTPACAGLSLVNLIIPAGGSVSCTFTVAGYAPPAGQSLVDTVRVTAVEVGNTSNSDSDQDTSTVTTLAAAPAPGAIAITVQKTNDADEDGAFGDNEEALEEGAAVTFRAVITNTGSLTLQLTGLTDAYEGVAAFGVCAALIGTTLAPGQSVTCTFTLAGYAPPPNEALPDTVTVTAVQSGNPSNSTSASDTSTVTTPEVAPRVTVRGPSEEEEVLGAPGGLAATGARLAWFVLLSLVLLAGGGVISIAARRGRTG